MWNQGISVEAADNPLYIENMYRFFRANAAHIAYENYYNRRKAHQLYPSRRFPKASTTYRQLWLTGR